MIEKVFKRGKGFNFCTGIKDKKMLISTVQQSCIFYLVFDISFNAHEYANNFYLMVSHFSRNSHHAYQKNIR